MEKGGQFQWIFQFYLFIQNYCYSQIDTYVHEIEGASGNIDLVKLINLIPKSDSMNIFLISEPIHRFKTVNSIKDTLLSEMARRIIIDRIFYENTFEHDTLLKLFLENKINISKYTNDKNHHSTYNKAEYDDLVDDNYLNFIRLLNKQQKLNILTPIDIGTQTAFLGLYNLADLTRQYNNNIDNYINSFLDSLLYYNAGDFYRIGVWFRPVESYEHQFKRFSFFLKKIDENIKSPILTMAWRSVFSIYTQSYIFREVSQPSYRRTVEITSKQFFKKNSLRDSVMYDNLNYFLAEKWKNVILSFSTLHLIDSKGNFNDVIDTTGVTLGQYLHSSSYKKLLRRVAFICYTKNTYRHYDEKHSSKSLEYKLSKKYNFAYIDLVGYRNDSTLRKNKFYMRPTFFAYIEKNWENIFDGVIFVRDCGCK